MYSREDFQRFLVDLSLIVPMLCDYRMIDWMILILWAYTVLWPAKSRVQSLLLISIVEFLWGFYDLSIGEYAQCIPFFFYSLVTVVSCLRKQEKQIL